MSLQPHSRMTVEEFLAWSEDHPGRHELFNGSVVAMSPQSARHIRTKYRMHSLLDGAIRASGLACEMMADGMTVRIDDYTAFEPDALVQCGDPIADNAIVAASPVVIVEVLSPGTRHIDTGRKLEGYFRVPSVMHYLVVDPERPMVIHHRRGENGGIETRIASMGALPLAPPGFALDLSALFEKTAS